MVRIGRLMARVTVAAVVVALLPLTAAAVGAVSPSPSGLEETAWSRIAAAALSVSTAHAQVPPGGSFWDDDGNVHEGYIEALSQRRITRGCGTTTSDLYCPSRALTRGEMAAFLTRALRLAPSAVDHFSDDNGSVFEQDINALAAARITLGCGPGRFCPQRTITRGEMAAFLVRAMGYRSRPAGNRFVDDDGSVFEGDIERLAAARVTLGCNPPANNRFCPNDPVRRDQMASFIGRALRLTPVQIPPRPTRTIVVTGDTLIHTPVASQAARYASGSLDYDFRPMFAPVRPFIEGADLALCHLEVPLTGRSRGVLGYPRFSSPPELADALAWAGYDGCSTASNHSVDQGMAGLVETIDELERAGLGQAGMARTRSERDVITMYDARGVKVAHLSATYGLNGLPLPHPWAVELIDVARLVSQAQRAKSQGANFVVVSVHCCIEYDHEPTRQQTDVFRRLLDSPHVDLVVGHHAHVVQPVEFRGEEYVIYGLGNFLSNQRQRPATTDGVLMTVEIARRGSRWMARSIEYTPTWVEDGTFRILPAAETIRGGSASSSLRRNLTSSWRRTHDVVTRRSAPQVTPSATP